MPQVTRRAFLTGTTATAATVAVSTPLMQFFFEECRRIFRRRTVFDMGVNRERFRFRITIQKDGMIFYQFWTAPRFPETGTFDIQYPEGVHVPRDAFVLMETIPA